MGVLNEKRCNINNKMEVSTPSLFYIKDIIQRIYEYIPNNDLLNCNKCLYNIKLKYYKLRKKIFKIY